MMKRSASLFGARGAALTLTLLFAACGGGTAPDEPAPADAPEPVAQAPADEASPSEAAPAPEEPAAPVAPELKDVAFHDIEFEEALLAAKRDGKVVFIDFFTTWCGPCKMLDKQTWPDPTVDEWLKENTVGLKIDAEKSVDLATRYQVQVYPTMVFIAPDGQLIGRLRGYMGPAAFLKKAERALTPGQG